jgi:hypothetical protein
VYVFLSDVITFLFTVRAAWSLLRSAAVVTNSDSIDRGHLMFTDLCIVVQFIKKNPTRCNNVSKYYYSIVIWSLTCFRWHTAYHQEPETALAASGFSYLEDCWTLSGTIRQLYIQQPSMHEKPEATSAILGPWWWAVCHPKHVEFHIKSLQFLPYGRSIGSWICLTHKTYTCHTVHNTIRYKIK